MDTVNDFLGTLGVFSNRSLERKDPDGSVSSEGPGHLLGSLPKFGDCAQFYFGEGVEVRPTAQMPRLL